MRMVRVREKETAVGLDLMLVLSTARLCSLNLALRRRSQVAQFCGENFATCPYITNGLTSYTRFTLQVKHAQSLHTLLVTL